MRSRRFPIRGLHLTIAIAAGALIGLPQGPDSAARADGGHFIAGPPWLTYACGNTFAIANPRPEPATVTFRVKGTPEEGAVRLQAAPSEDPHFSEAIIETREQGAVEIFLEGDLVDTAENDRLPCAPSTTAAAATAKAAAPATDGAWGAPFSWPMVAVHLSLLPDGRVLSWGKGDESDLGSPHIWNPSTGAFTHVPSPVWLRYTFTLPIADATVGLVKAASNDEITKPEDIAGKTVGVQQGTAQFRQLQAYGETLGGVDIKEYGTTDEAYADLVAGRLDAVAGSMPNLAYLVKERGDTFALLEPPTFGEPKYFAWVLQKGEDSASFAQAINDALLKMTDDGRVKAIQEKWLGSYTELPHEVPAS